MIINKKKNHVHTMLMPCLDQTQSVCWYLMSLRSEECEIYKHIFNPVDLLQLIEVIIIVPYDGLSLTLQRNIGKGTSC